MKPAGEPEGLFGQRVFDPVGSTQQELGLGTPPEKPVKDVAGQKKMFAEKGEPSPQPSPKGRGSQSAQPWGPKFDAENFQDVNALAEALTAIKALESAAAVMDPDNPDLVELTRNASTSRKKLAKLTGGKNPDALLVDAAAVTAAEKVVAEFAATEIAKLEAEGLLSEDDPLLDFPGQALTEDQIEQVRKQPKDKPGFAIGAMANVPADGLLQRWQSFVDAVGERITRAKPNTLKRWGVDKARWAWWGGMAGVRADHRTQFAALRGARNYSRWQVRSINRMVQEGVKESARERLAAGKSVSPKRLAAVQQKVHRRIEAALRGDIEYSQLQARERAIFDLYAQPVREVTDYILKNPWTHKHLEAFGFVNIIDVIRAKRQGPGVYLRRLYKLPKGAALTPPASRPAGSPTGRGSKASETIRRLGPYVRGGQFLPRLGDEDHWVIVDMTAEPSERYFSFSTKQEADKAVQVRHAKGHKKYGDKVLEMVRVLSPFNVEELEAKGILTPEKNVETLIARTITDSVNNLASLRLLEYLRGTTASSVDPTPDKPGEHTQVPENPAYGPLAGKWVPTPVFNAVTEVEKVSNHWLSAVARQYTYAFNTSHVVWNVGSTWARNLGSQMASIVLDGSAGGIKEITQAIEEIKNKGAIWRKLVQAGRLGGGFSTTDLNDLRERMEATPLDPGIAVMKWIESHPKISELARRGSARIGQWNEALAGLYDIPDTVTVMASYLKKTQGLGWGHEEAIRGLWMYPNNLEAGPLARWSRRSLFGSGIGAVFTEQFAKIFARGIRERPVRMLALMSSVPVLHLLGAMLSGLDDDEKELIYRSDPRFNNWIDRMFMIPLPFRAADGKPQFFNAKYWVPLGDEIDVTNPSGGLNIPFLFGQPWTSMPFEMGANADSYLGKPILPPEAKDWGTPRRLWFWSRYAIGKLAPLPSRVYRPGARAGGAGRLFAAAMGQSKESVVKVLLSEGLGIDVSTPWVRRDALQAILREHNAAGRWNEMQGVLRAYNQMFVPYGDRRMSTR